MVELSTMTRAALQRKLEEFRAETDNVMEARRKWRHKGTRLAAEALKVGYSERELADLMGVDRATIRNWLGK